MKPIHVPDLLAEADAFLTPPAPSNSGDQPPARPSHDDRAAVGRSVDSIPVQGGPGFTLPQRKALPRFADGEHHLVGRVGPPDEAEAEALARIICALSASKP